MPVRHAAVPDPLAEVDRRIKAAVYTTLAPLAAGAWVSPEPLSFGRRFEGRKLRLRPGDRWSRAVFDCAWFHFTGVVPADAAGHDVVLLIDLNGEGSVVDAEGRPLQGLTTVASVFSREHGEPGKRVVPWRMPAAGGEPVDLWVEAGANDVFGQRQGEGRLREAAIARRRPQLHALQYDFEVALGLLRVLPAGEPGAAGLREALSRAAASLHRYSDEEAAAARAILAPILSQRGGAAALTISAVGHAHMDLAWLWPIRETMRKCGRTFATALHLMQRYPGYVFGASQPQQYAWVKERYPELYAGIKRRVA
jgi:alpha-mannosidase